VRGDFRDGREWSIQVRECGPGEPGEVEAVSIPSLLRRAECDQIDLLKVDIEGAERLLFAEGCHDWLAQVGCLAVEVHDDECRAIVLRAVGWYSFDVSYSRGTLFCFRRSDQRLDGESAHPLRRI
jgi:hypothetical protein